MSIQYMAPGFKPMTSRTRVVTITTRPGLPPICYVRFLQSESKMEIIVAFIVKEAKMTKRGRDRSF